MQKFLYLVILPICGLLALTGCASRQVFIPQSLLQCERPARPSAEGLTVSQLTQFSLAQEAALNDCERKNKAIGEVVGVN